MPAVSYLFNLRINVLFRRWKIAWGEVRRNVWKAEHSAPFFLEARWKLESDRQPPEFHKSWSWGASILLSLLLFNSAYIMQPKRHPRWLHLSCFQTLGHIRIKASFFQTSDGWRLSTQGRAVVICGHTSFFPDWISPWGYFICSTGPIFWSQRYCFPKIWVRYDVPKNDYQNSLWFSNDTMNPFIIHQILTSYLVCHLFKI